VHAAPLPVDITGIKVEITNQPGTWTFSGWVAEVVEVAGEEATHIYVFYAGDLHNEENVAIPYEIDLMFTAQDGYRIKQVADETFTPPVETYTKENLPVSAATTPSVSFTIVDGDEHESEGVVHFLPLNFRQENMPNADLDPDNSTDLGGPRTRVMIDPNDQAFITGEPAIPQLRAQFRGAPETISIEWRLTIRTERPTQRLALDNRDIPAGGGFTAVTGNLPWDIEAALAEFVGGSCVLHFRIDGTAGSVPFLLRGKNPLDADARAHIDQSVDGDFTGIAWAIAQHESRQGNRVYNQFNTQNTIEGTLNRGFPNGWGIAQIDRPIAGAGVTTAEAWDWHENVVAMNDKLIEKRDTFYARFIGYFRDAYGEQENWTEPPAAHTFGQTTLSAQEWGVIVLYNGAAGVPRSRVPGQSFRCPWIFNPNTGVWTFHDNRRSINGVIRRYATEIEPEFRSPPPPTEE